MKTPNLFLENDEVTQTSLSDLISDKINEKINHFILKQIESRFISEKMIDLTTERSAPIEERTRPITESYEETKKTALNFVKIKVLNEIYKNSLVSMADEGDKLVNVMNKINLPNLIQVSQFEKLLTLKEKQAAKQAKNDNSSEKEVTMCAHYRSKHFGKGLCKKCYVKDSKVKAIVECQHSNEPLYAKGMCKKCYQRNYHKASKRESVEEELDYEKLIENFMNEQFGDVDFF